MICLLPISDNQARDSAETAAERMRQARDQLRQEASELRSRAEAAEREHSGAVASAAALSEQLSVRVCLRSVLIPGEKCRRGCNTAAAE